MFGITLFLLKKMLCFVHNFDIIQQIQINLSCHISILRNNRFRKNEKVLTSSLLNFLTRKSKINIRKECRHFYPFGAYFVQ